MIPMTLLSVGFTPLPSPNPSPPPPPSPTPPPIPPSIRFTSNEAYFGCHRADYIHHTYQYTYGDDERQTTYQYVHFNDTGLHDLEIYVDSETCKGRARVFIPHAQNDHVYSLYTSTSGASWSLASQHTYTADVPPPPTPSPATPSSIMYRQLFGHEDEASVSTAPDGPDQLYFAPFDVTQEPMYVRICVNCHGSCDGIDTIDSLVTCAPSSQFSPSDQESDEEVHTIHSTSIPSWVWIFVTTTALLAAIVGLGCFYYCFYSRTTNRTTNRTKTKKPLTKVAIDRSRGDQRSLTGRV